MDNARPHLVNDTLASMGMKRLNHPAYSPEKDAFRLTQC